MNEIIKERVLKEAELFIRHKSTVRDVAKLIEYSKSTVHKDLSERLKELDEDLYEAVRVILDYNLEVKHIRGGMATKRKYMRIKQK